MRCMLMSKGIKDQSRGLIVPRLTVPSLIILELCLHWFRKQNAKEIVFRSIRVCCSRPVDTPSLDTPFKFRNERSFLFTFVLSDLFFSKTTDANVCSQFFFCFSLFNCSMQTKFGNKFNYMTYCWTHKKNPFKNNGCFKISYWLNFWIKCLSTWIWEA